jgi:glycosyltransferase involved in cell wall biosynthesis
MKKVALVHDWLTGMRGGEKVLEVFCTLFPKAKLFTLVHKKGSCSEIIENMDIETSFLQKFPEIEKNYRYFLPLMPLAIEKFELEEFDLILSSSHCVAKGVKKSKMALHISYIHTPMRYVWDLYDEYFKNSSIVTKFAMKILRPYLQNWDVKSSTRVDYFIANSYNVKERIKRCYGADAEVIYPPVETDFFVPLENYSLSKEKYFLVVSAFVPYKKIDLVIKTFNNLPYKLKIIGDGPMFNYLKSIAKKNIEFLGWVEKEKLLFYYQNCVAFIFPQEEDFGITAVEAQSCGRPVIAYKKGGALETVVDGVTGIFFEEQTVESLTSAIEKFFKTKFYTTKIRENSLKFSKENFKIKIMNFIDQKIQNL